MPLINKGCYMKYPEDYSYEVETTYQLKYYIVSALISMNYILEPNEMVMAKFENVVQYYRFYVDNLFYFLGLINDRFYCKSNYKDQDLQEMKEERVLLNWKNYQFNGQDFNTLSNKIPRNIIAHLDERNVKTMMNNKGVGGFNVIFADSDSDMKEVVKFHREYYPYTLDLIDEKVLFYNIQAKPDDTKEVDIDLRKMQIELETLKLNVEEFAEYLKIL